MRTRIFPVLTPLLALGVLGGLALPACGDDGGRCGDGVLQAGEQCDDGNEIDADRCTSRCELARCGDGIVHPDEECDDGNTFDFDGCSNACRLPRCGDGILQEGEQCDDGNADDSDACPSSCVPASCGDGFVRAGVEACDDGNADDTDACRNDCTLPTCGDGVVQAGEQCDDGNLSNNDGCLNTCLLAFCGDGFLQRGVEECDDGNADDSDACLSTCEVATCGDGHVRYGVEACDDGNADDHDACRNDCALPTCGDGVVQAGEQCDDGNLDDSDACLSTCLLASCGDGHVQAGVEQCDDGNADDHDGCLTGCTLAACGDGVVRTGVEACDDGNADDTDACRNDCTLPTCGDGVVQAGEQCDDGNLSDTDGCRTNCLAARCGDGVRWLGVEQCDDGNVDDHDGCTNDCRLPRCGDGILQLGEQCDDGNGDDTDACPSTCQLARCGDGYVHAGVEACDDGNLQDTDACPSTCQLAFCGDGFRWSGVEACDDGNADNTDGCLDDCRAARCGDGHVWAGVEECDDANADNTDGCLITCEAYDWCADFRLSSIQPPVACLGAVPGQLTIEGSGFVVVEGQEPTVTLEGNALNVASLGGCQPLHGLMLSAQSCTSITVDMPAGLVIGDYEIEVILPVTQGCQDSLIFSVGPNPTVTSVVPALTCEGPNTFAVNGTGFVPSTQVRFGSIPADSVTYVSDTQLQVTFNNLPPGTYDVTVSNGPGCESTLVDAVTVAPNPTVYFVDPPVVYNGVSLQVTIYLSGINGGNVDGVAIRPTGTVQPWQWLVHTYDPAKPNRVLAVVPQGLPPGGYDVLVEDALGCTATLTGGLQVTDELTLALEGIDPPFGWTDTSTGVDLTAEDPPPSGMVGFELSPRVYLNPTNPGPGDLATALSAVGYVDPSRITALVPSGLAVGTYDVIVVNPDGEVGLLPGGYTVTADPPPLVDDVTPGSVPNASPADLVIYGSGFDGPTVTAFCKDPADTVTAYAVTVNSGTDTQLDATLPADQIVEGSVCVIRVTNPDGSYGEFSAVGVTNPAENIQPTALGPSLVEGRRAPAAAYGRATRTARFLYVFGGDDGQVSGAYDSIEAAPVDRFGELGSFRILPRALPGPRTLAAVQVLDRYVFLVGGNDGAGPVATVYRAEILDPEDAPEITDLAMELAPGGITEGTWYYRVSAVMDPTHPDNPGGESLPSDPQPVQVPAGLSDPLQVTLTWSQVPGAVGYRIYRTPTADLASGFEELLAEVAGGATIQYVDTGGATDPTGRPLRGGDLGTWKTLPPLQRPREGLGLAQAPDPDTAIDLRYLYAIGGRTTGSAALGTYEYVPVSEITWDVPAAASWVEDAANPLAAARWQLGALVVDERVTARVAPGDTWIYAGGGVDGTGVTNVTNVDAALVLTGGLLDTFIAVDAFTPAFAGYGHAAAANQLFVFGGQNHAPSGNNSSTQICGIGFPCLGPPDDPPDLQGWNALGFNLQVERYLLGSTVGSAHIFLVGGLTTGNVPTDTVESSVW